MKNSTALLGALLVTFAAGFVPDRLGVARRGEARDGARRARVVRPSSYADSMPVGAGMRLLNVPQLRDLVHDWVLVDWVSGESEATDASRARAEVHRAMLAWCEATEAELRARSSEVSDDWGDALGGSGRSARRVAAAQLVADAVAASAGGDADDAVSYTHLTLPTKRIV